MRVGNSVFVDSGAWIALAVSKDPLHARAAETWREIGIAGYAVHTSVPVIIESFTFLSRNTDQSIAMAWRESLAQMPRLKTLECTVEDLSDSWKYFERRDFHKLSAVDATSFVLMKKFGIRKAFAFDHHFASAGFSMVG